MRANTSAGQRRRASFIERPRASKRSLVRASHFRTTSYRVTPIVVSGMPFPPFFAPCFTYAFLLPQSDNDFSTPTKCKKLLRDNNVEYEASWDHETLAHLAFTTIQKKKRKIEFNDEKVCAFAPEEKLMTARSVQDFIGCVLVTISTRTIATTCVNVKATLSDITDTIVVKRCGKNGCKNMIKNNICKKCDALVDDASAYYEYLFTLRLNAWDNDASISALGCGKAGAILRF